MKEYVPLMSEIVLGERLKADEATTTIALQNMPPLEINESWDAADHHVMAVIRTGAIYVVPAEHVEAAIHDLPPTQDLPPLPFPRIVVETEKEHGGKVVPCEFFFGERDDTGSMAMRLVTILEVQQGREWNVVIVINLNGRQEYFAFGIKRKDGDEGNTVYMHKGMAEFYGDEEWKLRSWDELRKASIILMGFVINLVHLITAKNAPKEKREMIRQQRRAFKRKYFVEPPTVYRVKLEQAGEQEGSAGWHYTVRFLVCGHWRHYKDGTRSWIGAYIKGPAGAPWKGRPVHTKENNGD